MVFLTRSLLRRQGEDDGSTVMRVEHYLASRDGERPLGVYCVFDEQMQPQYLGYSRNMVLAMKVRVGAAAFAAARAGGGGWGGGESIMPKLRRPPPCAAATVQAQVPGRGGVGIRPDTCMGVGCVLATPFADRKSVV